MELRQQIEKWEQERKDAHPESRADMDVAKRLLAHGIEALDRIAQLKTDLAAAQAERTGMGMTIERIARERDEARAESAALKVDRDDYYCLLQRLAKMSPNNAKYLGIRIDAAIEARKEG